MKDQKVVCCFCGQSLFHNQAILLMVQPSQKNDDIQQIFCHASCLIDRLDPSIVLHPDLTPN